MTTTTEVPGRFAVGINGSGFRLDDRPGRGVQRRSVPFLRNQADTGTQAGAQSLNPAGVWRRSQEDWSHGAGQSHRDRDDSDPARFRTSKGINVWDRWKISLLPDTVQKRSTTTTFPLLLVAGGYLYVADGAELHHTPTLVGTPTWTAAGIAAGEGAPANWAIATDGGTVYAGSTTNGIHQTTPGATTSTHYSDLNVLYLAFVGGRLMGSNNSAIYNVTAGGAAPAALFTHRNGGFRWVAWADGSTHFYAGGHDNYDFSAIYKITIQPDGTALSVPTLAAPQMPRGERVLRMLGYAGYVVVMTNRGVRLAAIASDGNLTLGPPIPVAIDTTVGAGSAAVLDADGRYVWFSWSTYDATSGGLGRFDLATFTAPLSPAYASDLMVTTQNRVIDIVTFEMKRVFSVSALGVYTESADKVASGTIDSGDISFGITDDKVATQLDVAHETLVGSHQALLSVNGGAFSSLGTHTEGGAEGPFTIPETKGERFEIRHTLTRDTSPATAGPTLIRSTLSTYPTPRRPSEVFVAWLILHERETMLNGYSSSRDPRVDLDAIIALEEAGTVIDFQLGDQTYRSLIEDHNFVSENELDGKWWNGSVELTVRAI